MLDIHAPFVERNLNDRLEKCYERCELWNKGGGEYSPYPMITDFAEEVMRLRLESREIVKQRRIEAYKKEKAAREAAKAAAEAESESD